MERVQRRSAERGAILGVVMILLLVVIVAGVLATWGLRAETAAASSDRLQRQLLDCAEEGLSWGKQFFSTQALEWNSYFASSNVCSIIGCPPFPTGGGGTPPVISGLPSGQGRYPDQFPFTQTAFTTTNADLTFVVGILDNQDDIVSGGPTTEDLLSDRDNRAFVYSKCTDTRLGQSRAVQVLIEIRPPNGDYSTQAGFGSQNQGNAN